MKAFITPIREIEVDTAACLPTNVIRRWPAIMFAVNRTAKVRGRIRLLIVSINTINIISGVGVPCGTRWASISMVLLNQPNTIKEIHRGKAMASVIDMCLDAVKI